MDQEKTYKWVQERLRELSSGKLSEQDRARLVDIARHDPFVADALDGFHLHPDIEHTQHLDVLSRKISFQKRDRRRWLIPNLTVTAIAASLILIVGTWAVINRMDKEDDEAIFVFVEPDSLLTGDSTKDTNIALGNDGRMMTSTETASKQPVASDVDAPSKKETASGSSPLARTEKKEIMSVSATDKDKSEKAAKTLSPSSRPEDVEVIAEAEPIPPPTQVEIAVIADHQPAIDGIPIATIKRDEGYYANQMDPGLMARRVIGRVMDSGGQPLIGASLNVRNTNLGTTSDLNGRFELYLPLPESEVEISLTGYDDANVLLNQGEEEAVITLPAIDATGLQSILAGNATRSQQDKAAISKSVAPGSSEDAATRFSTYLKQNSRIPLRENYYSPGKEVTLEFSIDKGGNTDRINIISSSGDKAYDEEAVRLIRRSADWVCEAAVYPCLRKYTIYFQ